MESKFFVIYQVAEMLGMHHKTIRKFVAEKRLVASKVGKQWRVSGHDLSIFLESNEHRLENQNLNKEQEIGF
jgi:excisionase family DNA binding protein